jgi:signal transduction histidine kinase
MAEFAKEEPALPGATARTLADFRADLRESELARHLAFFHRSRDAQREVAAAYIQHGLQTGHRCLYLADVNDPERIEDAFRTAGVDVDAHVEAGDLVIEDAQEVYLDDGVDQTEMVATLQEAADESVAGDYEGLWMAGENSWCFHTGVSFDHIIDFEVAFDTAAPELPITALCQYDLTRFGEESAAKALWTHEQVIYRKAVCENPFYVPPDEYRAMESPHSNAQLMLEQAHSLTRATRQIERREQRLDVVNRVLRHNIRNDLTVVGGVLEGLLEDGSLTADEGRRVESALASVTDVLSMAEKARAVQRTVSEAAVDQVRLGPLVAQAVEEVERTYPSADIEVEGLEKWTVLADRRFDTALVEALTNAVVHQNRDQPEVTVAVSNESPETVCIEIRNPGASIPKAERRALLKGEETDLEHASGLGLWLIKWFVENSRGTVTFRETDRGAHLQMRLQRVR